MSKPPAGLFTCSVNKMADSRLERTGDFTVSTKHWPLHLQIMLYNKYKGTDKSYHRQYTEYHSENTDNSSILKLPLCYFDVEISGAA